MKKIIVTPENIIDVLLRPKEFSTCPSLRRMCTEAYILSIGNNRHGLQRLAGEAYASLSDAVIAEIRSVTGVEVEPSRRSYDRVMDVRRHASDRLGLQIDAGSGANAFTSMCLWRDESSVYALFAN